MYVSSWIKFVSKHLEILTEERPYDSIYSFNLLRNLETVYYYDPKNTDFFLRSETAVFHDLFFILK